MLPYIPVINLPTDGWLPIPVVMSSASRGFPLVSGEAEALGWWPSHNLLRVFSPPSYSPAAGEAPGEACPPAVPRAGVSGSALAVGRERCVKCRCPSGCVQSAAARRRRSPSLCRAGNQPQQAANQYGHPPHF